MAVRGSASKETVKPKPLDRDRIVSAALRLVRREGIARLTMRRLARELDAGAMSLYRHIADRDDLLLAMLDHVAQSIQVPAPQADETAEIMAVMKAFHDTFRTDPWLVGVLLNEGQASLHILPLVERIFSALYRLGLEGEQVIEVYLLLIHYSYGESLSFETAGKRKHLLETFGVAAADRYPASAAAMSAARGWQYREFQPNIARILKAITPRQTV